MKLRWLLVLGVLFPNLPAIAGGDGEFVGLDQQEPDGFVLTFSVGSADDPTKIANSIRILRQPKTFTDRGQPRPPIISGTGCYLFPEGHAATAIVCLQNAAPAFLRGVIYAKRDSPKKIQFVCVNKCSKEVPKYFVWVPNNEE